MSVYSRGKSWTSDFFVNGERFGPKVVGRKADMTKTEAKRIEAEWKREAILGQRRRIKAIPTFATFAVDFLDWYTAGRRDGSIRITAGKLKIMNQCFGHTPLDEISEMAIERFKRDRAQHRKPYTVNKDLAVLRQLLRLAVRWGYLTKDPSAEVKSLPIAEESPRVLHDTEAQALLMACSDKLRPLVQFALHTGLRYQELATLERSQLDLRRGRHGVVTVEGGRAKNRKRRSIPLTESAREAIEVVLDMPSPSGRGGGIFGYPHWRKPLYRAAARAGLSEVHPHTLRHTFASNCIMRGINPRTVQRFLGHASLDQTQRYTNPTEAHEHEAILALDQPSSNVELQHLSHHVQKTQLF